MPSAPPGGEAERYTGLVGRYAAELGRYAYRLTRNVDAAEDLTAEVFLAAWRQWERVAVVDHPLAYLRQVMANLAGARVQRNIRERRCLERLRSEADSAGYELDGATVIDVRRALESLPSRRRACLVLRYGFDLSERDVAEALGVTVGTVKSQTAKAARQLRHALQPVDAVPVDAVPVDGAPVAGPPGDGVPAVVVPPVPAPRRARG